ncbi:DUF6522 family protein [Yoonia vestfoldensis]|uniref:DUF6522 family protein n=1 Tax=Yoonia vestfoldensis TaxID=245188 RepID=UPI00037D8FD7|nr:DUF6522 family protein [Yoonia vestfoldensis]
MKLRRTEHGLTVDAADLGPLLGLSPADVPVLMRAGDITSQSETGIGEDEGKIRLTFWYDGQRVRLVCDTEGNVLTTSRVPVRRNARSSLAVDVS